MPFISNFIPINETAVLLYPLGIISVSAHMLHRPVVCWGSNFTLHDLILGFRKLYSISSNFTDCLVNNIFKDLEFYFDVDMLKGHPYS